MNYSLDNNYLDEVEGRLIAIVENISQDQQVLDSKLKLDEICRIMYSHKEEGDSLLYFFFAQALQKTLDLKISDLMDDYIQSSILDINFKDLFFNYFPPIVVMKEVISNTIISMTKNLEALTFCDFCSGNNTFILYFIDEVLSHNKKLVEINYIGINIEKQQYKLFDNWKDRCRFNFIPIYKKLDDLGARDWSMIKENCVNHTIATAFFSLHHTNNEKNKHVDILNNIKGLAPASFLLVEPDTDHISGDLLNRFSNSWRHFKAIYKTINEIDDITIAEKTALKWMFQKEIMDIMGYEQAVLERHEPTANWIAKLENSGFIPEYNFESINKSNSNIISLKFFKDKGYISIARNDISLLSIINSV